jgi:hypothetical protein
MGRRSVGVIVDRHWTLEVVFNIIVSKRLVGVFLNNRFYIIIPDLWIVQRRGSSVNTLQNNSYLCSRLSPFYCRSLIRPTAAAPVEMLTLGKK